jgi:hypothetical protein
MLRRVAGFVSSKRRENTNPVAQHNNRQSSQQIHLLHTDYLYVKSVRCNALKIIVQFWHKTILHAVSNWTGQILRGYLHLEHVTERKVSGKDRSDGKTRTDQTGCSAKRENAGNFKRMHQIALRTELALEEATDLSLDRRLWSMWVSHSRCLSQSCISYLQQNES